jgi:hypothetical protein
MTFHSFSPTNLFQSTQLQFWGPQTQGTIHAMLAKSEVQLIFSSQDLCMNFAWYKATHRRLLNFSHSQVLDPMASCLGP